MNDENGNGNGNGKMGKWKWKWKWKKGNGKNLKKKMVIYLENLSFDGISIFVCFFGQILFIFPFPFLLKKWKGNLALLFSATARESNKYSFAHQSEIRVTMGGARLTWRVIGCFFALDVRFGGGG